MAGWGEVGDGGVAGAGVVVPVKITFLKKKDTITITNPTAKIMPDWSIMREVKALDKLVMRFKITVASSLSMFGPKLRPLVKILTSILAINDITKNPKLAIIKGTPTQRKIDRRDFRHISTKNTSIKPAIIKLPHIMYLIT